MKMSMLDGIEIVEGDVPPGDGALTCQNCGILFDHTGRGRKPKQCPECRATKSTATATRSRRTTSKDVESAIAVLDGAYNTLALGLMMLSPRAATVWAQGIDTLQAANRVTLAGDPGLCKSILRAGEKSGKAAFAIAHVVALAPVVMAVRDDLKTMRKNRAVPDVPAEPAHENYAVEDDATTNVNTDLSFFG